MRTIAAAVIAALATMASASQAQDADHNWMQPERPPNSDGNRMVYMNGNQFLEQCRNSKVACATYVQGVNDALFVAAIGTNRDLPYCIPHGSTIEQVTDVVIAYVESRPEHRHRGAAGLVAVALARVWPQCTT